MIRNNEKYRLMKLTDSSGVLIEANNENVVFLNSTARLLWDIFEKETSMEEAVDIVLQSVNMMEISERQVRLEVQKFVEEMKKEGIIH